MCLHIKLFEQCRRFESVCVSARIFDFDTFNKFDCYYDACLIEHLYLIQACFYIRYAFRTDSLSLPLEFSIFKTENFTFEMSCKLTKLCIVTIKYQQMALNINSIKCFSFANIFNSFLII